MVLIADGYAACGDDQIAARSQITKGAGNQLRVIPYNPAIQNLGPCLPGKRENHRAVGVEE